MQSQPTLPKQDLLSQLYELPDKMSPEQAKQLMEETLRAYEDHIDRFLPLYVRVLGEEMLE